MLTGHSQRMRHLLELLCATHDVGQDLFDTVHIRNGGIAAKGKANKSVCKLGFVSERADDV